MVTSAIYRKLRTNDSLTSEEAAVVRRAMEGSLNKLKGLENEITRLQGRLSALCQRNSDTKDFVETHKGLLSPIRRLHRDILQEIFYQCLPNAHNPVLDPDAAPLVLGRVCRWWRQIAYTTPKLWSSLHIVATPSHFIRTRARFKAVSAWLSRSGALPLSISMSASWFRRRCGRRYVPINSQVQPYMNLILAYIKRWKRIYLSLSSYDGVGFFHSVNASDLPLLEVLHLEGDLMGIRDPLSLNIPPLSRKGGILFSPLLHVLSLPDYSLRLLELPVQWRQITALDLGRHTLPLQNIVKVLTLCSDLKICSISFSAPDQESLHIKASDISLIILPNLQTLKVIGKSGLNDSMFTLIDKLFTPQLRHFAYERPVNVHIHTFFPEYQASEPLRAVKSLCSFFQRLNEPLEEFDYWSNSLTRRAMMEILSFVPGLKRLSLRDFSGSFMNNIVADEFISERSFDDRFLAHFIPYERRRRCLFDDDFEEDEDEAEEDHFPASICLCPKLEVLNSIDAVYSERILLEFLRSRSVDHLKNDVSHLHHASITFKDFAEPNTAGQVKDITKRIERLEKDTGLVVKLCYPPSLEPPTPFFPDRSPYNGIQTDLIWDS